MFVEVLFSLFQLDFRYLSNDTHSKGEIWPSIEGSNSSVDSKC